MSCHMMHEVALESKKLTHPSELETFCENLLTQASDTPSYPLSYIHSYHYEQRGRKEIPKEPIKKWLPLPSEVRHPLDITGKSLERRLKRFFS